MLLLTAGSEAAVYKVTSAFMAVMVQAFRLSCVGLHPSFRGGRLVLGF